MKITPTDHLTLCLEPLTQYKLQNSVFLLDGATVGVVSRVTCDTAFVYTTNATGPDVQERWTGNAGTGTNLK